jgi:hypothetical protein
MFVAWEAYRAQSNTDVSKASPRITVSLDRGGDCLGRHPVSHPLSWLVEMFPTRIVAATGNIYSGLWYPIAVAAMSFVVAVTFLPETKDRDITRI